MVRLGIYMNAKRGFGGVAPLNPNAVANIEQLVRLRDAGSLEGVDALIRLSRDEREHQRQTPDGMDSTRERLWTGTRQFGLSEIPGKRLTAGVGKRLTGKTSRMLTAPGLADFLRALRAAGDDAGTALVLWGHADGPRGMLFSLIDYVETPGRPATSFRRDILSPGDVQQALVDGLPDGQQLDLVCFDACQGACLEFASVMAPHARYLIASQTPVPGAGWNYESWPALLNGMTAGNRRSIATSVAGDFAATGGLNRSISVIDLDTADRVLAALKAVAGKMLDSAELRARMNDIRQRIPTHDENMSGNVDLIALSRAAAESFKAHAPDFALQWAALAAAASAAVVHSIVSDDVATRVPLHGCSIYYPAAKPVADEGPWHALTEAIYYANDRHLTRFKKTGWHRVLQACGLG